MVVLLPPPIRTAISFSIRIFHSDVRVAWADSRKRISGGQVALFSRGSGECRWVQDILEHRRAAEGRLGIDHPIGLADRRQVLSEGRGLLTTASNAAVIRHDRISSWGRRGLFLCCVLTGEEFPCVCCCRQSGLVATSSHWWRWHCS